MRRRRLALLLLAIPCALLAVWLFVVPFNVRAEHGPLSLPGTMPDVLPARDGLIGACSPAFRQLVSPPSQGTPPPREGTTWDVTFPNLDPLCRDVGRTRALSSLGFAMAASLAIALAGRRRATRKPEQTPASPS
jgi:hypothetical protein